MSNFIISWIQLICKLCYFNYLNLNIMSYLFFKSWIYNLTYLTCLLNHNFIIIMCVIIMILSLKFLKIILYSSFHVFKYCFHTYFVLIIFINLHFIGKSFCDALDDACAKFGPEQDQARAPDIRWLEYTPVNLEQLEYTPLQLEHHFQHWAAWAAWAAQAAQILYIINATCN